MHRRCRAAALAWLIALALAAAALPARAQATDTLFHRQARFSDNLSPFTKWNTVIARADAQIGAQDKLCAAAGPATSCVALEWRKLVTTLRALPAAERIARANDVLNRVPYVAAETNWHDPDHWETPYEFLARGGQCQDYAIAKIMALAESGVPEQDLRLVVVHDRYLGLDHAIAVVYLDGEPLVLDNQVKAIMPATRVLRYDPYYAINRQGWWSFDRAISY